MGHYRYSQTLNVAYYALVFCVLDARPLLIVGLFKLVASLALACLLAFVVVHSADICRLITVCLRALPVTYFPLGADRRWAERLHTAIADLNQPSLSPQFQRPPPVFSV